MSDLKKIADFLNNNLDDEINEEFTKSNKELVKEKAEKPLSKEDIDNALSIIDKELEKNKVDKKELSTTEKIEEKQIDINGILKKIFNLSEKVDKNTDDIYEMFYNPILLEKDRSESSKIALLDSQRLKVELMSKFADVLAAQAKLEQAKAKTAASNNVLIQAQDGAEVGISLHNLWEQAKEDEDDEDD